MGGFMEADQPPLHFDQTLVEIDETNATIRKVITFVHQNELAALDEKFIGYI